MIRVLLNAEPMQPLTIPIVVQPNDGITTDDYSGVPMSVTFAQGQKEQSFTVAALLDQEIEGNDENFRLEFGDLPSGVAVGDVGSVRVWLNDEQAGGVVTVTGGQTPEVGQVLTAVTTGVVSEHGLTQAVYAYQWRRLLTAAFALHKDIDGATDATYTPTLADAGNRLYVVAHITDDAGNVSRIDSAATSPVADNSDDVLFSNWTVATDHIVTVSTQWEDGWGFPFGTGDHPSGYFLSSVNIATTYWGDSRASISIWSARTLEHGEIVPDIPVILLVLPQPRTQETVPLTAPEGSWLAPDTTYFLVLHEDRRGSLLAMVSTLEIELDPATDAGWSYGNRTARRERLWETHAPGVYGPWRAFNYGGTQSSPRPKFSLKGEKADLDVVTVSFAQPSYEVDEGGTVTVTVELDADPDSELVIPLRLTEVGASSADYTDVPEFLTFPDGVRTQTFTVRAVDDTEVEDDESLSLAFGMLPPGVAAGAAGAETTIEIIDNDVDEEEDEGEKVKIWFELAELTGLEGTEREIKVQMTLAPGDYVTIPITTENLDGASSDDYSGIPQEITFGPNDSEKAFRVSFTDDSIDDDDERVRLGFGSLPDWLAVGNPSESTILIYDNDDPEVTVSFAQSSYTVGEGGTVMVTVELNADPERTLMIPITRTSTNGAARPTDYRVPGNVTFLENETSKTITFTAIDDTDDDDDESVQLSFGNLPDRVFGGTPSATEVAIIDDDDPFVRVSFGESSYTVGEGGTVTVTVEFDADPERTVVIPISVDNQDGATGGDYSGVPASVSFHATDRSKTFNFAATQDTVDDDDESVELSFGAMPDERVSEETPSATTVAIIDDDDPYVRVSFAQSSYSVDEGGTVTVTVELDFDPERTVVIPITQSRQNDASLGDYSGVPPSVTFLAGQTSKTFSFAATQDTEDDDDESVELSFGAMPDARVSEETPSATTVEIIDDDDPIVRVSFAQSSYEVDEGGTVTVTVELDADPERTVEIPITGTGTPLDVTSPGDYSGVPSSITFHATETSKTFSFAATQDTEDDDDESVELSFDLATLQQTDERVLAGATTETVVAIIDDDDPIVRVSFAKSSYEVDEGGTVTVTVELDVDPERTVVIPISVDNQDGATGGDYSGVPASVSFHATDRSKTFNFAATQDTVDDDDESVELSFGAMPDERVSEETPSATTVAIIDDDDPYVRVSFAQSSYEVDEGGTVTVTVELDFDPERTVVIPITQSRQNDASLGDYSGVPPSVTFLAGQTSKTFSFAATQDTEDDDDESVQLGFGSMPDARVSAGTQSATEVAIIDDDDPIVRVSFAQPSYSVDEAGTVTVTVELDADPERTVVIPISRTPRNGASGSDYSVSASVTFRAGEMSQDITFSATHDTLDDDDESVELSFGALPDRVLEGATTETVVAIIDDDDPEVTVSFGESSYTAGEGSDVVVTVELSAEPERTVVIPISRTPKDGATGGDYSGVPASVSFSATETSKTFRFAATQDTEDDDDERVELSFGALPERVSEGTPSATTVEIEDDDDPEVTVSFGESSYTAGEGSGVTVTVELDAEPERTVVIPINVDNQNGATGGDYSDVPASVSFSATETSKTFRFSAVDDTLDDDDERVELSFGALPERVSEGTPSATTVAIIDDDDPYVRVSFAQSSYEVDEDGTVTVTVELDFDPERTVVIPISQTRNGASLGDYSGVPSSITFHATETSKTFSFAATQDTEDDDDESVQLGFGSMPDARVSAGTPSATTVAIIDDDDPIVRVSFAQSSYEVDEGGTVTVTVELDADPERTVVIPISRTPRNGASGSDYSVSASVTFRAGEMSQDITFSATHDTLDDDDESVELSFGALPDRVLEGATTETVVAIIDDDDPEVRVSFAQSSYEVDEGSTVTVTVELDVEPERTVVIPITQTRNGASGGDYSGVPSSVTFTATDRSKTFSFAATQDTLDDDDESVQLGFGSMPDARVSAGTQSTTTVAIIDDDDPIVRVSFAQSSYEVDEGGTVTVTVELDVEPERTVVIPISVDNQDGASGGDYSGVPASITFHATDRSKTFNFAATQDTEDDDDESVQLSFGNLPDRVQVETPSATAETVVAIIDDDDPIVRVSFAQSSYEVDEGGTVTVTVELDVEPERTVVIPITRTENGATGSDYSGVPASVSFNATERSKTFNFAATQDTLDDDDESVQLSFGNLPDRVQVETPSATAETVVAIIDDDDPYVRVSFAQSSYEVDEGGTVTVTVELDAEPERTVVIPITQTRNGASGGDYSGVPASITFHATDRSKTFNFAATHDTEDDDDESVELGFGSMPDARVSAGTQSTTTVAIIDDDDPIVRVSFGESSYEVDEGGTVTVTVELDVEPERTVVIPISVDNQDGASGGDYSGVPASITFHATDRSKTFNFAATQDTEDDDDESVQLSFGNLPDRVQVETPSATAETVVAIIDDDDPIVRVSFAQSSYEVDEGGTVTVTVELDVEPERTVVIPITRTENGATGSDYSGVPASVSFNATERSKTFNFAATQDTLDDDDESVQLSFGNLPDRVQVETPSATAETVVAIIDDDDPYVRVSFAQSSYEVDEGGTVTVTVELDAEPERTVVIPITQTRNGASGGDYSGVPASITFHATDRSKTFNFAATHDTEDDDDESVELGFGSMPDARVSAGTQSTTTVAIIDDDDPIVRVSFGESSYEVDEGGTVTVTVELDVEPERTVVIPISVDNQDGASGGDYSGVPASITFHATDRSKTFNFAATQDTEDDDDESVQLSFGNLPDRVQVETPSATAETVVAIIDDDDPIVRVSFAQSSYEVDEGGTVTVTVELDVEPERTVVIPITRTENGATGSDYSGVPASVSFNATERSKTFNFAATQDTLDDDDESVQLSFGNLPDRVQVETPSATAETVVAIIDDDDPYVRVSFAQSSYEVDEGGTVTVTVELDAEPERTVVIPITQTRNGASGGDYSGVPASITFHATDRSKTFNFAATHDTEDDDDESVELGFGSMPDARVSAGTQSTTTVAIIDDDDPIVRVSFGESSYEVDEGGTVTVTVELDVEPERTVVIPISVDNQDGATGGDYSGVPSSVTFHATEMSKTINFAATQDTLDDDDESVELSFGAPPERVSGGTPSATTVAIIDDDMRGVTVTPTSLRIDEGSDDTYRVVLDSEPLGGNVTVTVVAPDNLDLSVNQTSLTFRSANWDTPQEVRVSAGQDSDDIDDQDTIRHTVSGADYASETANSVSVKVIDDEDPQVRVSYGLPSYTVREGSEISITVTLSKDPERTVVIPISRNQDGASGADYTVVPTSVTFNATETSKTINFAATQDTLDDDDESVKLSFGSPLPLSVATGATPETTVAIIDDDDPEVRVSFEESSYEVDEGGTVTVTVELDADPERTVVIPITQTRNGATGGDYSGVPSSITFHATERSKTFNFAATQDTLDDDGESVRLSFDLQNADRVFEGTPSATTVAIIDDDDPEVRVSFAESSYSVDEGGAVTVTVELDADPERTVVIPITRTENGATGSDYSGVPASVTFNATETRKTFSFAATQDSLDDDDESVTLSFDLEEVDRVVAGTPRTTEVAIGDGDVPEVTVSFAEPSYSVAEGGTVTVTVELDAEPERTVVIPITRTPQKDGFSGDYSVVPTSITFNATEMSKTITFMVEDDTLDDDGERVTLGFDLRNVDRVFAGSTPTTTVAIDDDDDPEVSVRFVKSRYSVAEGGDVTVTVELSDDPERTVVIPITRTPKDGATGGDYSGVPAGVSFNATERSKTFSFAATQDTVDDDDESVRLSFDLQNVDRVFEGTPSATTVAIIDDDDPEVRVSFAQSSYSVAEGGTVTVTVELDAEPERTVEIPITRTENGATGSDYSGVPASVTFNATETRKTFSFAATQDSLDDDDESVTLSFDLEEVDRVVAGTPRTTEVAIGDGDVPEVTVSFAEPSYSVAEGGTVTVTVELDAEPERTVVIPITRTPQKDGFSGDYSVVPTSITFNATEMSKTITFMVEDDTLDDDGERVTLGFDLRNVDRVFAGSTPTTTVAIDDDDDPEVSVRFVKSRYSVAEGGDVTVTVELSDDPERTVVIPITRTPKDGATGGDYSGVPASVSFNATERSKTFNFAATQDTLDDDDESVRLSFDLQNVDRIFEGTPSATEVAIIDDDDPEVRVSFAQSSYSVAEGGTVTVTVELDAEPERTVEIPITRTENGATGSDYSGVPASVTFNATETRKTFSFAATQDSLDDDGESVTLSFDLQEVDRVVAGTPRTTEVAIGDGDVPEVTVSFAEPSYRVAEGGTVTVTVELSAEPERTVVIPISAANQDGATGSDYSGMPASVTFNATETRKTFSFAATQDSLDDDGERVTLGFDLRNVDRVFAGSTPTTTVAIDDDDDPEVRVSFAEPSYSVEEGGDVTVTVELSDDPERTVVIPITRSDQGGASSGDYSVVPTSITFNATEMSKTITFSVIDDTVDDDNESVELGFGLLPDRVSAVGTTTAIVSIEDNDGRGVTVSESELSIAEGGSATYTIVFDSAPTGEVLVTVEAPAGSDFSVDPQSLSFTPGNWSVARTVTVSAAQDDDSTDDTGTITHTVSGADYTGVTARSITVSSVDDEEPQVAVSFERASYSVSEGESVTINVILDRDPERSVTVRIDTEHYAGASDDDYSQLPDQVTFASGETEQSFGFGALDDDEADSGEQVLLSLDAMPQGVSAGAVHETTITITEQTSSPGTGGGGGGGGGSSGPSPSLVDFEWNVKRDIEALARGHDEPTGMWSDGTTLWLAHNGDGADDAVYAYDLESGERVEDLEFALDDANRAPRGVWSNRGTVWISDSGRDKLFAHDLETGERLPGSDLQLHPDNDDARGIWSGRSAMWVLDGRDDALFAYDLQSGELLAEYALHDDNDDPHGIWSDGVSVWVSDHGAKLLFAYRLPVLGEQEGDAGEGDAGEGDAEEDDAEEDDAEEDETPELERVTDEEFTLLSSASNNSPRGIWSDGDVMYVADQSDARVYSYNMPDAIDARLASLTLSGVDIGEFDPGAIDYEGVIAEGVTETTVEAAAMQRRTNVEIHPLDANGDDTDGYQVALEGIDAITVTVTSADGSRTRVYRVRPSTTCLRGDIAEGFSLVVYEGGPVEELVACAESRDVVVLYALHEGVYIPYILGAPDFVNAGFTELYADGVPALTPLIAGSNGPPSEDPLGDTGMPQPWPECLRGEIAEGFSPVLYEGGSVDDLAACAQGRGVTAVYTLAGGEWISYILGAPEFVNQSFAELFPDRLPAVTPLVAKGPVPAADASQTGAASR